MAARYVIANGGNYNAAGTWATSSANAAANITTGGSVPTSADDVFCDAGGTLTMTASGVCRSFTGSSGSITGAFTLSIGDGSGGAFVLSGTFTLGTTPFSFVSTSTNGGAGWNVDFGGKNPSTSLTFNNAGGRWKIISNYVSTSSISHTSGYLDLNGKSISHTTLAMSNTNVRTLDFNGGTLTLTNNVGNVLDANTTTNLTLVAGSASNLIFSGSTAIMRSGTATWPTNLTISHTGVGNFTFDCTTGTAVFTINGPIVKDNSAAAAAQGALTTAGGFTTGGVVCNGTVTLKGNAQFRVYLGSNSALGGSVAHRFTFNGTLDFQYVDILNVTNLGSTYDFSSITTGRISDNGFNSGFTFLAGRTMYWVAGTGNWYDPLKWSLTSPATSGSTTGNNIDPPVRQDNVVFVDNSTSAATLTATVAANNTTLGNIDMSAVSGSKSYSIAWGAGTVYPRGSLYKWALTARPSVSGVRTWAHRPLADCDIYSNGAVLAVGTVSFGAPTTGTITLRDAFSVSNPSTNLIDHQQGTLTALGNVTGTFQSIGTLIRALNLGSGTWSHSSTSSGANWDIATTGLTFDAQTSTVGPFGSGNANSQTVNAGAGLTYNKVRISANAARTAATIWTTSNTIKDIAYSGVLSAVNTGLFTPSSGVTLTIPSGGVWGLSGASGFPGTVRAATSGTPFTIASAGAGSQTVSNMNIKDSTVTGATYYDYPGGTDNGGNTGWAFTAPVTTRYRWGERIYA